MISSPPDRSVCMVDIYNTCKNDLLFLSHIFALDGVQGLRFRLQYVSGGWQEPVRSRTTILIEHENSDEPARQKTEIKKLQQR